MQTVVIESAAYNLGPASKCICESEKSGGREEEGRAEKLQGHQNPIIPLAKIYLALGIRRNTCQTQTQKVKNLCVWVLQFISRTKDLSNLLAAMWAKCVVWLLSTFLVRLYSLNPKDSERVE